MPTHEEDAAFLRDIGRLTPSRREQFLRVLAEFIADLSEMEAGQQHWFRPGSVRKLSGTKDLYELRWASDGRATFSIGDPARLGRLHIRWHRCGTHDILP